MAGNANWLKPLPVALQLYTVRDQLAEDFDGVIRQVGEMGYDGVQFSARPEREAREVRRLLDDCGLEAAGAHVPLEALETRLEAEIDYAHATGNRWLVCPSIPERRRRDLDGWQQVVDLLSRAGERCKAAGLSLGYHNHAFEFAEVAGSQASPGSQANAGMRGIDIILTRAPADLLFWEPDVYWIHKGGADPAAMIRDNAGRVPLTHLKDVTRDERATFAEVGEGALEWPQILRAAQDAGAQWHCVEQDRCDRPPLESARRSLANLRAWGMGRRGR
jgi:sugar phosphate isomerase/epimerase